MKLSTTQLARLAGWLVLTGLSANVSSLTSDWSEYSSQCTVALRCNPPKPEANAKERQREIERERENEREKYENSLQASEERATNLKERDEKRERCRAWNPSYIYCSIV